MYVWKRLKGRLYAAMQNRLVRQTGIYSLMQIFSLGCGFLSNVFLAKEMGAELFGIYSFAVAVMAFVSIFFEFGLFSTAAKILADTQDRDKERQWLGAFLLLFFGIGALMSGFILWVSFFIDDVFTDKIGGVLASVCLVSYAYILPNFMELVLKGSNEIYKLSSFNLLQRVLFLLGVAALWIYDGLTPVFVFYVIGISNFLAFFFVYFSLRPSFVGWVSCIRYCVSYNATYGWALYWGRIAGAAAYNIDKLLISYFANATVVGFYSLAQSFATPIATLSNALSIALFRQLAKAEKIDRVFIRRNLQAVFCSVSIVLVFGYGVMMLYLPDTYNISFYYLLLMACAMAFQGAYGLYNSWLMGHGYTRVMRNIALRIGIMDVVSNFLLIMWWGGYGACFASVLDMGYSYYLYKKEYGRVMAHAV